jgi:hypothetical protein
MPGSHVQRLLVHNQDERQNQLSQMWKHGREESKRLKAVEPEVREEAVRECRAINEAAFVLRQQQKQRKEAGSAGASASGSSAAAKSKSGSSKSKSKSKGKSKGPGEEEEEEEEDGDQERAGAERGKNSFDPSGPQLAAMIEDLKLRKLVGVDVILEDNMGNTAEEDEAAPPLSSIATTARTGLAELERRRREREKSRQMKEDAVAWLQQALETERERDIRDALKYARQADLQGELSDGSTFCTAQMFKVGWVRGG